jgi:hypothetical protein
LQKKNVMASPPNSGNEENQEILSPALNLSQLSSDNAGEQIAQVPPEGSASASHISRPCTPTRDEKDDLALALRVSPLPSDFDEQVARLHRTVSAPISQRARSSTPPDETDENEYEPADTSDEQGSELNRRRESRMAVEDDMASLLMAMSRVKVRTTPSLYLGYY